MSYMLVGGGNEWVEDVGCGITAIKCHCKPLMSDMERLILEYWTSVLRGYTGVQEAESSMRSLDSSGLERRWLESRARYVQDTGDVVSDYTSEWASTDAEEDEQDADMEQDIARG